MTARPAGIAFDKGTVRRKYAEERRKRLRPNGDDQYMSTTGPLARYARDPYTSVVEREPLTGHRTVVLIGGGFAGLVTGARLKTVGVEDVCVIDKGGDFGGAWYWNRYPGVQCDTASYVYLPLLEETGYVPTEKYAHGPEVYEHCRRIGKHYGLYDGALFHTLVEHLSWEGTRWRIRTDRGDDFTAQFVALGVGPLNVPKLPGVPGIESFRGHSFHSSRWDYDYTGGDPSGAPMDRLADARVAVIGTGPSAVQCVPHLARACRELYVFQRTPSSVDVRDNAPTDPAWFARIATPGWQQRLLENFAANQTGFLADEDLVADGWTDITRRVRARIAGRDDLTPAVVLKAFEDADFEKMSEIRARVDSVVEDPETARKLKAWYRWLCKRPCFHDDYLQAFNTPRTHLVDTDGKGVERITPNGVVAAGREYEVDCVVYASGFEGGVNYPRRAGFDMVGRDGVPLSRHWAEGMRTLHGIHVRGFPNAFLVQPAQGGHLFANNPHNIVESAKTIAAIVKHALGHGFTEVDTTAEAVDAWVELLLSGSRPLLGSLDCTPGIYNNEGRDLGLRARLVVGHPDGAPAYFRYINRWRSSGRFEGLQFR